MNKLVKAIEVLVKKAQEATTSESAVGYSQAASNLSNALWALKQYKD